MLRDCESPVFVSMNFLCGEKKKLLLLFKIDFFFFFGAEAPVVEQTGLVLVAGWMETSIHVTRNTCFNGFFFTIKLHIC